jgi:hypothetical protein
MAATMPNTMLRRDLSIEEKFEQLMSDNPLGAEVCEPPYLDGNLTDVSRYPKIPSLSL